VRGKEKKEKTGLLLLLANDPLIIFFLILFWVFYHFSCLELLRGILDCIDKIEYIFSWDIQYYEETRVIFERAGIKHARLRTRSIIIKRFFSIIENIRFRKIFFFPFCFFLFDEGEMMERTKSSSFQRTAREN
jgi:hypothetical protein